MARREWAVLRAYAERSDQRQAAASLGISWHTMRHLLDRAYRKLDVASAIEAFRVVGWLRVPEDVTA